MKKTNKGFSMVELIIVIAIMAILAGALAPQLIKYINKSRLSTDVQTGDAIAVAATAALANEEAYEACENNYDGVWKEVNQVINANDSFGKEMKSSLAKTVKGKSKKDIDGSAFNAKGSFYLNVNLSTNTVQVVYGDSTFQSKYLCSPTPGEGMAK